MVLLPSINFLLNRLVCMVIRIMNYTTLSLPVIIQDRQLLILQNKTKRKRKKKRKGKKSKTNWLQDDITKDSFQVTKNILIS